MGCSVLIVDDHELFATTLRMALSSYDIDAYHLTPHSVDQVVRRAGEIAPRVVTVDLDLSYAEDGEWPRDGEVVRALSQAGWNVLIASGGATAEHPATAAAIAAGAIGAVHKSGSFQALVDTVRRAAAGEPVMTQPQRHRWILRAARDRGHANDLVRRVDRLSTREREVLGLLAEGYRAVAIAEKLVVTTPTVHARIRTILAKLEVNSQLEAVALTYQLRGGTQL